MAASDTTLRRRARILIPDAKELSEELELLVFRPNQLLAELEPLVAEANEYSERPPMDFASVLSSDKTQTHSFIEGLAAQQPNLILASEMGFEINCSREEILDGNNDFLLTAPAGFGKTSFCRWNVLHDLKVLKDGRSFVVPIYVALHKLAGTALTCDQSTLLESTGAKMLWDTRNEGKNNRRFRFYLDGLGEVPNEAEQHHLMAIARGLKAQAPDSQLVVTGREHIAGPHLQNFIRAHVLEMNDEKLQEFINVWFSHKEDEIALFQIQLDRLGPLKQVMRAPLLATLVLSVYMSTRTVPESRSRLYDMFINLMAGGWDVAKRIQRDTQFGPQPKITVLQNLAGRLQLSSKRDASRFDFTQSVKTQLPSLTDRSMLMLKEIIHDGLLVPVGDNYIFSHLSFQEYLAARDLMEPSGKKASTALTDFLRGNDWWKEVLGFYVTLSDQPKAMEVFVREHVFRVSRRSFDDRLIARGVYLLEQIKIAYPDSNPDFAFPELVRLFQEREPLEFDFGLDEERRDDLMPEAEV